LNSTTFRVFGKELPGFWKEAEFFWQARIWLNVRNALAGL
jgi:hypothetical protein